MTTAGRIVLVGNEKGGTGKTTLAITLATLHAAAGHRVAILDADPGQQSATAWWNTRSAFQKAQPEITLQALSHGLDVPNIARSLATTHDLVVMDTGASDGPYLRAGMTCANTMVLPTSTEALELWVLQRMEALLTAARPANPTMRLVVAASRTPSQRATTTRDDLADWIAEHAPNLPMGPIAVLVQRAAVARATAVGLGITELTERPDPKATSEARTLYANVMRP